MISINTVALILDSSYDIIDCEMFHNPAVLPYNLSRHIYY